MKQRPVTLIRLWLSAVLTAVMGQAVAGPGFLLADEPALQATNIRVGLDGACKLGAWTAIEFDVQGPVGKKVVPLLRSVDPDGHATLQPFPRVQFTAESPVAHVRGFFRAGKLNSSLSIQLRVNEQILATFPIRNGPGAPCQVFKQSTKFWLTVGNQPLITRGLERWNDYVPESAHHITLDQLDGRIWSELVLDGLDVLVMNADVAIDQQTSDAVRDWVSQGGRMIVAVGNLTSQLSESPLSSWLPMAPTGQVDVAKLSGLQELVPRSSVLRTLTPIPSAILDRTQGVVVASGLSGPLALRAAYGTGQVTMVAVRMDEAPLSNWEFDSQAQLAAVLASVTLPWNMTSAGTEKRAQSDFDPSSVTDLQGQMNQSLDHFEGIRRTAPWTVIGWIAVFAIIIGPLDFLVVRTWLKRPEWTWGTMTLWVVLGSFFAISRANALNTHELVARQMDSIDIDLVTDQVRGESWYSYYSEANQRRAVTAMLNPEFLAGTPKSLLVSWVNRPGEGFRGMAGSGGLDETKPVYEFLSDRSGIKNFPVRKWSSGALNCQWRADAKASTFVEASLEEGGLNRLTGTIRHQLPGELTDWFLAYGNFAYFERPAPGEAAKPLPPGVTWIVSQAGSNLLRGRLVGTMQEYVLGKQSSAIDDQIQKIAYDRESTDPRLCQLVSTFYQVLGGESYTGLRNESLSRQDLSEVIMLKKAVLFGRLKVSPASFQLDGEDLPLQDDSVMVRILLPVKLAVRDRDAPPPKDLLQAPK